MEYTDQTSGAIRLYLARGNFDIAQFTVLNEQTIEHNGITVRFGILGESHFVRFEQGGEVLNEICACVDAKIENPQDILAHDFLPNLHTVPVTAAFGGRTYSFTFTYADWPHGEEKLAQLRTQQNEPNTHVLTYEFPKHDNHEHQGITEVYITTGESIEICTVHSYPNEHMMVFTESVFH